MDCDILYDLVYVLVLAYIYMILKLYQFRKQWAGKLINLKNVTSFCLI